MGKEAQIFLFQQSLKVTGVSLNQLHSCIIASLFAMTKRAIYRVLAKDIYDFFE